MMEADPEDVVVMEGELKNGIYSALSACYSLSLSPESVHLHQTTY